MTLTVVPNLQQYKCKYRSSHDSITSVLAVALLLIALTLQIQGGKCYALGEFLTKLWSMERHLRQNYLIYNRQKSDFQKSIIRCRSLEIELTSAIFGIDILESIFRNRYPEINTWKSILGNRYLLIDLQKSIFRNRFLLYDLRKLIFENRYSQIYLQKSVFGNQDPDTDDGGVWERA